MKKKLIVLLLVVVLFTTMLYCSTTWYIAGEPSSGVTATQAQSLKALAESATWTSSMWAIIAVLGSATDATIDSLVLSSTAGAAAIDEKILQAYIGNLNRADTVFVVSPYKGVVSGGWTVISGTIATADQKLFVSVPYSGASWDDSVTIAYTGSATGTLDTISTFTETGDTVLPGQAIGIKADGACTNSGNLDSITCMITFKLRLID